MFIGSASCANVRPQKFTQGATCLVVILLLDLEVADKHVHMSQALEV